MVSPSLGINSSKASVLERSFWDLTNCGMIASRRRLIKRLWETRRIMVLRRTLHLIVRKIRVRGRLGRTHVEIHLHNMEQGRI
jgi:hypothetical protein